jgi:hypothetical protein
MAFPQYPVILTKDDWERQKGAFAKMAGRTGIGDQMKVCKGAYDKIDKLKFSPAQTYKTMVDFDEDFEKARAEHPKVEHLRTELRKLVQLAEKTAAKFKANKLIPSSSAEHCKRVAVAADHLAVALKSLDMEWQGVRKRVEAKFLIAAQALVKGIHGCEEGIPKVEREPTGRAYNAYLWQRLRTLAAAVAVCPDYAPKWQPILKPLSSATFTEKDAGPKIVTQVNKVKTVVRQLRAEVR